MSGADVHHGPSQPWLHQHGTEIQQFGTVRWFPIALSRDTRLYSCQWLNQILADTQILYAHYKKHHWLVRGHTFYQLHLLLDKHAGEQLELVDKLAERVQTLGGVAVGDPRHVAEITQVPRAPNGVEDVPAMLSRLIEAHEIILAESHDAAARVGELGDDGSNDVLVSDIIRTGEMQAWFLAEHLVDTPLVRGPEEATARPSDQVKACAAPEPRRTPSIHHSSGRARVTDEAWANAAKHYDEEQLTALVSQIAVINAFNRLNVITQQPGGDYQHG